MSSRRGSSKAFEWSPSERRRFRIAFFFGGLMMAIGVLVWGLDVSRAAALALLLVGIVVYLSAIGMVFAIARGRRRSQSLNADG